MEIRIRDDKKTAEVWLTRVERDDISVQARLKPMYADWKRKGYMVSVFLSGEHDLYRQTSDLLCYNHKRIAQLEVQRDKSIMQPHSVCPAASKRRRD